MAGEATMAVGPGANRLETDLGDEYFWGVDQRDARNLLPGLLNDGQNLRYEDLIPQTRRGVVKPAWLHNLAAGNPIQPWGKIYGRGVFRDPSSLEWAMLAADGNAWACAPNNWPRQLPLPAGVQLLGKVTFCQAFDQVFCFRGRALAPLVLSDFDTGFVDILQLWNAANIYNAEIIVTGQAADEVAYGPFQAVTSIVRSGNTATVVTTNPHGYITGADVTITGANQSDYNGRFNITVVDSQTFTYVVANSPVTPATGTIKVSNMALYWKALGSQVTLSNLTNSGGVATATKTAHGFTTGQYVTIAGAAAAAYNGTFQITVTGANTFTYPVVGSPTSPDANIGVSPITAQTSIVLAGQSPDTNPEAWTRVWNILPNADNALYVNNQLLVPTAYNPSSADNYATFNGATYAKKDYIVATDYLDPIHFDFSDEFRINQGSADEIVDLAKFNESTVVVWKSGSWGVLSNVSLDLSQLTWDTRNEEYGLSAMGAWAACGSDLVFLADKRGLVSIRQSEQAKLIAVDLPLSAPIPKTIGRINWTLAAQTAYAANWDSRLYVAVPLDNGMQEASSLPSEELIAADASTYIQVNPILDSGEVDYSGLVVGARYRWVPGANEVAFLANDDTLTLTGPGTFTSTDTTARVLGPIGGIGAPFTGQLFLELAVPAAGPTNNAILVYDFIAAARGKGNYIYNFSLDAFGWTPVDTGSAIVPNGFFKMKLNGAQRLFYTGSDGYVNLVEESDFGDQVPMAGSPNNLGVEEIQALWLTRSYFKSDKGFVLPDEMAAVLQTWNPNYSVETIFGAANKSTESATNVTLDRTKYFRPWDAPAWDPSNVNLDFATPDREDYSVALNQLSDPFYLGAGVPLDLFQEQLATFKLTGRQGRSFQVELTNSQGRVKLLGVRMTGVPGRKRRGTQI